MNERGDIKHYRERYGRFKMEVQRLVDFENARGETGHFSQKALEAHGFGPFKSAMLTEHDMDLLDLFFNSLQDAIRDLHDNPQSITSDYIDHIGTRWSAAQHQDQTPSQEIFNAYLNNQLLALMGILGFYVHSRETNNRNALEDAKGKIEIMGRNYLSLR